MPSAPEKTAAAIVSWVGHWQDWALSANYAVSYMSETYSVISHAGGPIDAYKTHAFGINVARNDWRLKPKLAFNVVNLLDERNWSYKLTAGFPVATIGSAIQPRTMTMTLSLEY